MYNQGTTQLTDCTVSGNSADRERRRPCLTVARLSSPTAPSAATRRSRGGGLASSGTATLYSCTLGGNSAAVGGGIDNLNAGTATLDDTIVAANTGASGSPSDIGGNNAMDVVGTYDLVGTGGSGGISNGSDHDIVLSTLTGLGLAHLGNYGGPTDTIALLPGSPAIGAGIEENGIDSDQRGEPLDSPSPDIGAFPEPGLHPHSRSPAAPPRPRQLDPSFADSAQRHGRCQQPQGTGRRRDRELHRRPRPPTARIGHAVQHDGNDRLQWDCPG